MTAVHPTADPVGFTPEHLRMVSRAAYSTAHLQLVGSGIEQAIALLDMGKTQQARDMLRMTLAGAMPALNRCQNDFIQEGK